MSVPHDTGILFVISAPSGTGKSTVANRLLEAVPDLEFSVSFTTRPPRRGEQDGREYHFVDQETFDRMVGEKRFLEWAPVFQQRYGTGLDETRRALADGRDLLLDIDVKGAGQVRQGPIPSVAMMILPPDYPTLEARLHARNSEPHEVRTQRLSRARDEAEAYEEFDYLVVNDDLERTVQGLASIVEAERLRVSRAKNRVRNILATFPERPGGEKAG